MIVNELENLLGRGEEQYRILLDEATVLLRNFDTNSAEEYEKSVARRQEVIDRIQNIDSEIAAFLEKNPRRLDDCSIARLEEYRAFQEVTTRQILELDSLVIGLAKERLVAVQGGLAALSKGKVALHGYEALDREKQRFMSKTA